MLRGEIVGCRSAVACLAGIVALAALTISLVAVVLQRVNAVGEGIGAIASIRSSAPPVLPRRMPLLLDCVEQSKASSASQAQTQDSAFGLGPQGAGRGAGPVTFTCWDAPAIGSGGR
jgi:hypothetical protein